MRWDKKDIPHKGWIEIGMEDLGEEAEFGDEKNTLCSYYEASRVSRRTESRLHMCVPHDR